MKRLQIYLRILQGRLNAILPYFGRLFARDPSDGITVFQAEFYELLLGDLVFLC
jgi:hypothetical protein